MSIIPKNEAIRKAVKWISEQRQEHPKMPLAQLINQVTLRFDLNPNDSQFLINFYKEHKDALPKIEAVIFDMDGLMIDSERIAQQAWTAAAREWGYPFEPAHYLHVTGITVRDAEKKFKEIFGADFPFYEIRARRSELVEASFQEHGIPLKPGLLALLEALKSRAIPRAVATSAGHKYAIDKLTRAGLLDWFDTLVGGDQITHGKPHPEIFLSAAAKLGADPARCLVLEDSEAGIRAAHAAGMIPVMVPDRKAPSAEVRRLAWQVVETLDEVREMIAERGVRSAE